MVYERSGSVVGALPDDVVVMLGDEGRRAFSLVRGTRFVMRSNWLVVLSHGGVYAQLGQALFAKHIKVAHIIFFLVN